MIMLLLLTSVAAPVPFLQQSKKPEVGKVFRYDFHIFRVVRVDRMFVFYESAKPDAYPWWNGEMTRTHYRAILKTYAQDQLGMKHGDR